MHLHQALGGKFTPIFNTYAKIEAQNNGSTVEKVKAGAQEVLDTLLAALDFSVNGIQNSRGVIRNAYSTFLSTGWYGASYGDMLADTEYGNGFVKRQETAVRIKDLGLA